MPYKDPEKQKQYFIDYKKNNKEKVRESDRKSYYKNHKKRLIAKKLWAEKNKEKLKEYRREYRRKYVERKKVEQLARSRLHNAIRFGKIVRPDTCSNCNMKGLIHAHHNDYSKPLEVEWLCHQCHFNKHLKGVSQIHER